MIERFLHEAGGLRLIVVILGRAARSKRGRPAAD